MEQSVKASKVMVMRDRQQMRDNNNNNNNNTNNNNKGKEFLNVVKLLKKWKPNYYLEVYLTF